MAEEAGGPPTLRGMHDTLGGPQASGFKQVEALCGVKPTLWSGDFGFSNPDEDLVDDRTRRKVQLQKMLELGRQGVQLTLSWHQCNPTMDHCTFSGGVQKPLSDVEWDALLTPGTPLNLRWRAQVAELAEDLKVLEAQHLTVLLRPYHEANIPGMWWHGRTPQQSIALWNQFRAELLERHHLKNLKWVWSVSAHPKYWGQVAQYYPGDASLDIIGVDIYPPAAGHPPEFERAWDTLHTQFPSKPLALTEVSALPSETHLKTHSWTYVVPWGINMLRAANTLSEICDHFSRKKTSP